MWAVRGEMEWTRAFHNTGRPHNSILRACQEWQSGFIGKSLALVGYEPISDRVLVVRLKAKPRNISLIQVYGRTTAATDEEMEMFYQDLSQAVKQVPKGDMLLVMGDFNAKVGNVICSRAVWLRRNK